MSAKSKKTSLKDGWVVRDSASGRVMTVKTEKGLSKARAKSHTVVKEASSKRHAALKRLADR